MRPVPAVAVVLALWYWPCGVLQNVGAQKTTEARSVDRAAFTAAKEEEVANLTGTIQAKPTCFGGRGRVFFSSLSSLGSCTRATDCGLFARSVCYARRRAAAASHDRGCVHSLVSSLSGLPQGPPTPSSCLRLCSWHLVPTGAEASPIMIRKLHTPVTKPSERSMTFSWCCVGCPHSSSTSWRSSLRGGMGVLLKSMHLGTGI